MANPKKNKYGFPSNWSTVYYQANPLVTMMSQINTAGNPLDYGWSIAGSRTIEGGPVYTLGYSGFKVTMWFCTGEVAWVVRNSKFKIRRKYLPSEVGLDKITFEVLELLKKLSNKKRRSKRMNNKISSKYVFVPVVKIKDNPFQARIGYNDDDIADLAYSIKNEKHRLVESLGLINVPKARLVYQTAAGVCHLVKPIDDIEGEWHVELIEGHRRKRAFQYLGRVDDDYHFMPLDLVAVDDDAMDDICWKENWERKELSIIEQAKALQNTIDSRELTHEAVGTLRGMSRSAVSNKVALLELPDDIQMMVHKGEVSERKAMAILPLFKIDKAVIERLDAMVTVSPKPKDIIKLITAISSDAIRQQVAKVKEQVEAIERAKEIKGVESFKHIPQGSSSLADKTAWSTPDDVVKVVDDEGVPYYPNDQVSDEDIDRVEADVYGEDDETQWLDVAPSSELQAEDGPPSADTAVYKNEDERQSVDLVPPEIANPKLVEDKKEVVPPPPPPPPPPPVEDKQKDKVVIVLSASLTITDDSKVGLLGFKVGEQMMYSKSVADDEIKPAFEELFKEYLMPALH